MKWMNHVRKALCVLCYLALGVFLFGNLYAEHSGQYMVPVGSKLAFGAGFLGLWTLAVFAFAPQGESEDTRQKRMRFYFFGILLYYIWILGNMLFFDAAFGRLRGISTTHVGFYDASINLEPLKTIRNYIRAYDRGRIRGTIVAINLLGNLAAFAPMGILLPALFRPMRNFFYFFVSIVAMVSCVEVIQILTLTGSCDIDDLILNTTGALAAWLVCQLPFLRQRVYCRVPLKQKRGREG